MQWIDPQEITKQPDLKPMDYEQLGPQTFARYTAKFLLLPLIVLLLVALSGCSKAVSVVPMPTPPANLQTPCQPLSQVPDPLIDPERALWESDLIAKYADCSVKHRLTVEAWQRAVQH